MRPLRIRPLNDFADDKLSVLDLRATDMLGNMFHVEVQMAISGGFRERMVYYPCQMYGAQLRSGDDYSQLKPVYSIYLVGGKLWPDSKLVHQTFRLADCVTGRVLNRTLEIHTLELGCYNLRESQLGTAGMLDRWIFWLLRAQDYSREELERLFPDGPIFEATRILEGIELGEELGYRRGVVEGKAEERFAAEIRMVQELQRILGVSVADAEELGQYSERELREMKRAICEELTERRKS